MSCAGSPPTRSRPTCTVVVLLEDDERTMLPDRGANAALTPGDLDLAGAAADCRWGVARHTPPAPQRVRAPRPTLPAHRAGGAGVGALAGVVDVGRPAGGQPRRAGRRRRVPGLGARAWTCCCPTRSRLRRWAATTRCSAPLRAAVGVDGGRRRAVGDADAYLAGAGSRGRRGRPDRVRRRVRRGRAVGVALRGRARGVAGARGRARQPGRGTDRRAALGRLGQTWVRRRRAGRRCPRPHAAHGRPRRRWRAAGGPPSSGRARCPNPPPPP